LQLHFLKKKGGITFVPPFIAVNHQESLKTSATTFHKKYILSMLYKKIKLHVTKSVPFDFSAVFSLSATISLITGLLTCTRVILAMLSKWSGTGLTASILLASPGSLAAYSVAYVPSTRIMTPTKTRTLKKIINSQMQHDTVN
jgi:hypothetical protein